MYCVGLIGQIGSGKSTVAQYFNELGIASISADVIAKELTKHGKPAFDAIVEHFGPEILDTEMHELDRKLLRQRIFKNSAEKRWLEHLLHPMIQKHIEEQVMKQQSPYCLVEIPLLQDKTTYPYLRRILLVQAHQDQQIKRIMARDQCNEEEAKAIVAQQVDKKCQETLADDMLFNTGSVEDLKKQVVKLHQEYVQHIPVDKPA